MKKQYQKISRRSFIERSALISSAALLAPYGLQGNPNQAPLSPADEALIKERRLRNAEILKNHKVPKRILGRTGLEVSALGLGGGSVFLGNSDAEMKKIFERSLEVGINYIDTFQGYGRARGEKFFGEMAKTYRDQMVIQTKLDYRSRKDAEEELEIAFKNLQTDYLDIVLVHLLNTERKGESLDVIEDGVWDLLRQKKEEGVIGHIGFSVMKAVDHGVKFIDRFDPDVLLVSLPPDNYYGSEDKLLPAAKKNNMGVVAMKIVRKWLLNNPDKTTITSANELLASAYSMEDVHGLIVGHVGVEQLEENAAIAITEGQRPRGAMHAKQVRESRKALAKKLREWSGPDFHDWGKDDYLDNGFPYKGEVFV